MEPLCHARCAVCIHCACWLTLRVVPFPGYSVARVKLGDYYYYGIGTEANLAEAVDQYRMAADHMANSQAMFNLGYMYELGIGLQQVRDLVPRAPGKNLQLCIKQAAIKKARCMHGQMSTCFV